MIEYRDLSLHLSKEQLQGIVHELVQSQYLIFWGFQQGMMILNVYHARGNNQFTFTRHRHSMEMTGAKIADEDVLQRLDRSIQFTVRAAQQQKVNDVLAEQERYEQTDFYLGELHRCLQEGNESKAAEIKGILAKLSASVTAS